MLAVLGVLFANGLITVRNHDRRRRNLPDGSSHRSRRWRLLGWSRVNYHRTEFSRRRFCFSADVARPVVGRRCEQEVRGRDKQAIESHPNVVKVVELLTMHLAPKQILINAHVNLRDDLKLVDVVQTNEEIEDLIKRADPKVETIFLETARASESTEQNVVPEHMA